MPRAHELYREIAIKSAYFLAALSENPFVINERKLFSVFLCEPIESKPHAVPREVVVSKWICVGNPASRAMVAISSPEAPFPSSELYDQPGTPYVHALEESGWSSRPGKRDA